MYNKIPTNLYYTIIKGGIDLITIDAGLFFAVSVIIEHES